MTNWYYLDENNQRQGPHEEEKILELLQNGSLNAQTLVWTDGMGGEWAEVSTIPALSNAIEPLPPNPPSVPVEEIEVSEPLLPPSLEREKNKELTQNNSSNESLTSSYEKLDFKFWVKYIFSIVYLQFCFLLGGILYFAFGDNNDTIAFVIIFLLIMYGRSINSKDGFLVIDYSRYKLKSVKNISSYTSFISIVMFIFIYTSVDSFPKIDRIVLFYLFAFSIAFNGAWIGIKSFIMEKGQDYQLIWSLINLIIFCIFFFPLFSPTN